MQKSGQGPTTPADPTQPSFRLRTLGEVSLTDASGRSVRLRTRKSVLLLACLASQPDRTWNREKLAGLFWSDRQDEQARNSLRSALSDIRGVLGKGALVVEGGSVALAPGIVATDIAVLRSMARQDFTADPGELRAFYGGDFFADADEAADSMQWIGALRAECRDLAISVLERATASLVERGLIDLAISRARESLSLDPLSESSHRLLMRLYAEKGERSKSLAQFQSCRQILQHELGVEPSAETRKLADQIAVQSEAALDDLREIASPQDGGGRVGISVPAPMESADANTVSIAVLPFVNMSGDADQSYFAEGMSEDIVTDLSKVSNLSVAGASSTRPYRAANMRPDEIAAELGVQYILEGSVRRSDRDVRITTSLIDGRHNRQIWAERYDRQLTKVFDVQSEIAANVAKAIQLQFSTVSTGRSVARGTNSPEAHEHYLKGRALLNEMTRRSVEISKQSFERAIEIDKNYALAYAGVAESISMLAFHYEDAELLLESAIGFCHKALELDPNLAEAYCSLGRFHSVDLHFEESEAEFQRAIKISPELPEAHFYRGLMYLAGRQLEEAVVSLRRAFELSPRDLQIGMMLINGLHALNLPEESEATASTVLDLARRRMNLNPYDDQAAYVGAFALSALGQMEEALRWANVAAAFEVEDARMTYNLACVFAVLGEKDRALTLLKKTLALGVPARKRTWIRTRDSDWDKLRSDPRFSAMFRT